jgi:hypothetical protein
MNRCQAPQKILLLRHKNINLFRSKKMETEIKFWESVILSGKNYEPRTKEEEAAFDIALYFVQKEQMKKAA